MTSVLLALEEPLVRIGARVTIDETPDFDVIGEVAELDRVQATVSSLRPDILLLDSRFQQRDPDLVPLLSHDHANLKVVVMVDHTDEACTLRSLLSGPREHWPADSALKVMKECCLLALRESARGCIPKASEPDRLVSALRAVAAGEIWAGPGLAKHWLEWWRDEAVPEPGRGRQLTAREIEIIGLVVEGLSNREIAERLDIKEQSVKNHIAPIMRTLGVRNRVELALKAVSAGIAR
jgi:DNA-binding NarL/FixJ family response regulator